MVSELEQTADRSAAVGFIAGRCCVPGTRTLGNVFGREEEFSRRPAGYESPHRPPTETLDHTPLPVWLDPEVLDDEAIPGVSTYMTFGQLLEGLARAGERDLRARQLSAEETRGEISVEDQREAVDKAREKALLGTAGLTPDQWDSLPIDDGTSSDEF